MSCITNKSNASQENNSARVDWLHCARRLAFLCVFLHSRMTVWETSPPFPTRSPDSTCQEPALTNTGSEAHSTRKAMYKPQRDIYAYSASVLKSHCHDLVISELEERRIINCLHSPNNSSVVLEVPAQHSFKSLHALQKIHPQSFASEGLPSTLLPLFEAFDATAFVCSHLSATGCS